MSRQKNCQTGNTGEKPETVVKRLQDIQENDNMKSALSAVISRNGSHNIGSHVLTSLSHRNGTMPDDQVFYQYIQQRMGYIANACTEFPQWATSTWFVGDMMRVFFSQHHLLEYIADSEGLHAYRFRDAQGTPLDDEQRGTIKLCVRTVDRNQKKVTHFVSYYGNGTETQQGKEGDDGIPFNKDVALAIPGGIVGQHAFFTILENIIRNAAKHGWGMKTCQEKADLKNLEIHISFEQDRNNDELIEFTIWDNVSDVFSPLLKDDGLTLDEERIRSFLNILSEVNSSPQLVLGGKKTIKRKEWITTHFSTCLDKNDSLASNILSCWENAQDDPLFDSFIKTPLNQEEINEINQLDDDFKSFVPLHMKQQALLAKPILDHDDATDRDTLQRGNWGLAEMKISAGYLRHSSLNLICRENNDINDIILARPVKKVFSCPYNTAGDDSCSASDCKNKSSCLNNKKYHLGYRFRIKRRREILIILNKENRDLIDMVGEKTTFFTKEGVFFGALKTKITGDGDEKLKDLNLINPQKDSIDFIYDYVVFPTEATAKCVRDKNTSNWLSHFPFRLMVGKKENNNELPVLIAYDEILNVLNQFKDSPNDDSKLPGIIYSIKNIVYRDWLKHIKAPFFSENTPPSLLVKTDDDQKNSNYFFTNRDLLQFVFQNFFELIFNSWNNNKCPQSFQDALNGLLDSNMRLSLTNSQLEGDIFTLINAIKNKCPAIADINIDDRLIQAMKDAYFVCDYLFRGKKGNCSTLPDVYIEKKKSKNGNNDAQEKEEEQFTKMRPPVFLNFISDSENQDVRILYQRHLVTNSPCKDYLYAEQLSGVQSYFNIFRCMSNPKEQGENVGFLVRLVENALLRIMIIDERVSKFLTEHKDLKYVFYNMNIFAMDFSNVTDENWDKAPWINKTDLDIDLDSIPLFLSYDKTKTTDSKRKWEILIIHQGVIDKWFPKHSEEEVEKLFENLRNRAMYPVITSGRGRPDNIPEHIKFLPFSTIEKSLFAKCPEKMVLTATIMNLLPSN